MTPDYGYNIVFPEDDPTDEDARVCRLVKQQRRFGRTQELRKEVRPLTKLLRRENVVLYVREGNDDRHLSNEEVNELRRAHGLLDEEEEEDEEQEQEDTETEAEAEEQGQEEEPEAEADEGSEEDTEATPEREPEDLITYTGNAGWYEVEGLDHKVQGTEEALEAAREVLNS